MHLNGSRGFGFEHNSEQQQQQQQQQQQEQQRRRQQQQAIPGAKTFPCHTGSKVYHSTSLAPGCLYFDQPSRVTKGSMVQLGVLIEGPRGTSLGLEKAWCRNTGSNCNCCKAQCNSCSASSISSGMSEGSGGEIPSLWRWSGAMLHVRGPLPLSAPCLQMQPLLPSWHFDMILDSKRNSAYERAIR